MPHEPLLEFLRRYVSDVSGVPPGEIDPARPFSSYGLTSIDGVRLARALGERFDVSVPATAAWDHPTIGTLVAHLSPSPAPHPSLRPRGFAPDEPIAIIGMGCRFPGAGSPAELFDLLCRGDNPIQEVPADRWAVDDYYSPEPAQPAKTVSRWGGFLDDLTGFDSSFFRMSPREAAQLDPRQRLMLEVSWEAFEDAGIPALELAGSDVGVFVATLSSNYGSLIFDRHLDLVDAYSGTGNGNSVTANRLSYFFDLRGPSIAVDTACSGSLVTVHLACQSLRNGDCALALAGGVNVILKPDETIFFSKTGALSPDGRCRVFDRKAQGIVRSEGAGVVVLARLSDALAARHRIYAVVRATAVNQDGASNGIMAPNGQAQVRLLRDAYARAGVSPGDVQYIEAHGTGTALGDPIEVNALASVLADGRDAGRRCALGSIKSNIGHTEAAAGVAGLIKTALCLSRRIIPGNLHFEEPNPLIPFDRTPFDVQATTGAWPHAGERLFAGVSAFGFAGTNAHVVLEEAPAPEPVESGLAEGPHLLLLSARHEQSLRDLARRYAHELSNGVPADALCHAAATRRSHLDHRAVVTAPTAAALRAALEEFAAAGAATGAETGFVRLDRPSSTAFLLSGQGSHWPGMGRRAFHRYRAFREVVEACDAYFTPLAGRSLIAELARDAAESRIDDTDLAQPAIFAVQAGLCALWRSFGVRPRAVLGQSLGEIAAAYASGALSLEDAVRVVWVRSRLMRRLDGTGGTTAVGMDVAHVRPAIARFAPAVAIAGTLASRLTLVSGPVAALDEALRGIAGSGVFVRPLPGVRMALHGPDLEAFREEMLDELASIAPRRSEIPFVSSVTGGPVDGQSLDAGYWYRNLREPFNLPAALAHVLDCSTLLEVSPHPMLATPVSDALLAAGRDARYVSSFSRGADELTCLFEALGRLHAAGLDLDWSAVFGAVSPVLDLPPYPWHRERHWYDQLIDAHEAVAARPAAGGRPADQAVHPWLDAPVHLAMSHGERIWETRISASRFPFLGGHRVQGTTVLPGAAYVEMALAAARALEPEAPAVRLTSLTFAAGMVIDTERIVQTVLEPRDRGADVRIFSAAPDTREWTLHARGSLVLDGAASRADRSDPPASMLPGAPRLTADDHYRTMARRGLDYAGAFRALGEIRTAPGEALAVVEVPESAAAGWLCHPAALDACLQLVAAARPHSEPEDFRLPVGIDEVRLDAPLPARFWAHARLAGGGAFDEELLSADITLYADDGTVLGRMGGAVYARVGSSSAIADDVRRWFLDLEWRDAPNRIEAANLPPAARVAERFGRIAGQLAADLELQHYGEQWADFDRLSAAHILTAFQQLGVALGPGLRLDEDASADRAGVVPQHRRLWRRLVGVLREEGVLDADDTVRRVPRIEPAEAIAADLRARFPNAQVELALIERGGTRLAQLLGGEIDPLEILFAHEKDDLLERLYRDSTFMRYYNAALVEAVAEASAAVPLDRPLRVLEIGGGTGATTDYVLPALAGRPCEFVFTDVSPLLLDKAARKFAEFAFVTYRPLDIERDPAGQGFAGQCFDVVIAANVLHATADLRETLAHVRELLAPAGWLLLLEGSGPQRWLDLIVGGTDGWWRVRDRVREGYPLLHPEGWTRVLLETGFEDTACIQDPTPRPPQFVIVARSTRAHPDVAETRWLIVGGASALDRQLAAAINRLGGECVTCRDAAEASHQLAAPDAADRRWHLVYTRGLDAVAWSDLSTDALAAAEREIAYGAVELVQALVRARRNARLWIVTRNAQAAGASRPLELAQTPLWGVGRVAASEHPEMWGGLVDLDDPPHAGEAARLVTEIVEGGGEDQVAYRGGARLVARLARSRAMTAAPAPLRFRRDGAYLITGGLRGIGLAVAQRIVDRGARHLILNSRTPLPPRREWGTLGDADAGFAEVQAVRGLEASGAHVELASFDVADEDRVRAFLDAREEEGRPPVRGVVHSAGLIHDQLLAQADRDAFSRVTRAKIQGAWVLHDLLRTAPLDLFVLFSSGTSLLGTFGQANYAAGNVFLDGLAHHRRALGLPAISINWGVWASIGIVARMDGAAQLAENGLIDIRPELGLEAFERILAHNPVQVAAMPTDWRRWRQVYPRGHERRLFADLIDEVDEAARAAGAAESGPRPGELSGVMDEDPVRRDERVRRWVGHLVARVMRLDGEQIDEDTPLTMLGLDSIMAVEIRNRIETECPAGVSIVELLEGLSVEGLAQRVVATLGAAAGQANAGAGPVPEAQIPVLADRSGLLACSPAQEELWRLEAANRSRAPVYNVPVAAVLNARLDPVRLRRALEQVVARHEPLRTSFRWDGDRPWQIVSDRVDLDFRWEDLSGLSRADQAARSERLALDFSREPFDLEVAPLARFLLLVRHDSSLFVLNIHHLVFDGWSAGVLVGEIAGRYEALGGSPTEPPSPPAIQFADYAAWARARATSAEAGAELDYWRRALAGGWEPVDLPRDYPSRPRPSYRGAKRPVDLDPALSAEVRRMARQTGATPFMVFAAALGLLLHVESGQQDIVIATTPSNRERPELSNLVGYFVNTTLLRIHVDPDASFEQLLSGVRETTLGAFGHETVSLEPLLEAVRASSPVPTPPIQVVLTLQNSPMPSSPLVAGYRTLDNGTAKFEIVLNLVERATGFDGWWEYSTDVFRPQTVDRLADGFVRLLQTALADPRLRPAQLAPPAAAPAIVEGAESAPFQLPEREAAAPEGS